MWLFLISPLGRRVAAITALVIILGVAILAIYNRGKAAGQIEGARAQLEDDRKSVV